MSDSLNPEKILEVFKPENALSKHLKGFESREAQLQMLRDIIHAFNHSKIALIEAGTGTGKSLSYLVPAALWAKTAGECTVISTNTISLQEQLLDKDIPLLAKILNMEIKAVLVKGMSNYICIRKLKEECEGLRLLPEEEYQELSKIERWFTTTSDGTRSSLSFVPSSGMWEKVCAEVDTCNRKECPHFQECYFFKARRQAADAQLLIVNHHLLFSDLACRNESEKEEGILPNYKRVILDEAHHIEDIATEHLSNRLSQLGLFRILGILSAEKRGKLTILKEKIDKHFSKHSPKALMLIYARFMDLNRLRHDLNQLINSAFSSFNDFIVSNKQMKYGQEEAGISSEEKLRVLPMHSTFPIWNENILPHAKELLKALEHYIMELEHLENDLKQLKNEPFDEHTKGLRFDIQAYKNRLAGALQHLSSFVSEKQEASSVRWVESQPSRKGTNVKLITAQLDVAPTLANVLFNKYPTIVMCSATLTSNKQFSFIRQRLGLNPPLLENANRVVERIYESPFNYPQQALFAIPIDIPHPQNSDFTKKASEQIWSTIQASRGNAFVLFTSYSMLRDCYQLLSSRLTENRYIPLKQGDASRQMLLEKFKNTDRSVLFGTDSFWEGVDVVGEALRCVIIVKLPFKVPTEPIIQARTEAIEANGGDSFLDYSLPQAIVKFKQGFGRLIRNNKDRGCIVCLDTRIITKNYGRQFLNSIPNCQQSFMPSTQLQEQMIEFYLKTNHLAKKTL